MGLDMYLEKDIYIGGNYKHREVKGSSYITVRGKELNIPLNKISTITLQIGYWRKANHIHKWFVDNVQDGVDECQRVYVSKEKLIELKETCEKVVKNKKLSNSLLPRESGFFFGGTEYDRYYFDDIKDTIAIINDALEDNTGTYGEIYYHSSW
jgi:hypothetical protein